MKKGSHMQIHTLEICSLEEILKMEVPNRLYFLTMACASKFKKISENNTANYGRASSFKTTSLSKKSSKIGEL